MRANLGLSSDAANAIDACDRSFGHYYHERFHKPETTVDALTNLKTECVARQQQLAELNKHLDYIKQAFCETADNALASAHKSVETLRQESEALAKEKDHDPALRFLRAIKNEHELGRMREQLVEAGRKVSGLLKHAETIGRRIWKAGDHFPAPSVTMFNIVKCPKDGTKLRLPKDSADLVVSCPTCHYRFAYNTTCISFETSTSKPPRQELSWMRRIWNSLRGH